VAALRRFGVPQWWAFALAAILLAGAVGLLAPPARAASAPTPDAIAPCPGAEAPSAYTGVVADEGGPAGGVPVQGLALEIGYAVEATVANLATGATVAVTCATDTLRASSNASGGFAFALVPAPTTCTTSDGAILCTSYSGPYGNLSIAVADPLPLDYAAVAEQHGPDLAVDLVALLATVALDPAGPTAIDAPGANLTVAAAPFAADGVPTPGGDFAVDYQWNLTGPGWTLVGPANGSSVTVVPAANAGVGNLSVTATAQAPDDRAGTFVPLTAAPAAEALLVAATAIVNSSENRTVLDVGGSVAAAVRATGAAGFAYAATFDNGEAGAPVAAPCTIAPAATGTVAVACAAPLTFPATGPTTPTVEVSNGYSAATVALAVVTVDAPPELAFTPGAAAGYAGAPIPIGVTAADGTGPFLGACLSAGGAVLCSTAPGPTWTFAPAFVAPGPYAAHAWAIDADGANASANATVTVVPELAVAPITGGNATAGVPVPLASGIVGGFLPVAYYVNASDSGTPLAAGVATADGPIAATFDPAAAGVVQITVTAVDARGARATAVEELAVAAAPATAVRPLTASGAEVVVGTATEFRWRAFGAGGRPASLFAPAVELTLSGPSGPVAGWANASGLGALVALAPGRFAVPSAAWLNGSLAISVAAAAAGSDTVDLNGSALPGAVAPVGLAVSPDLVHLRLSDPRVAVPGLRTNATEWTVTDRFGDAVPGAEVTVAIATPAGGSIDVRPVTLGADGATYLWLNVSLGAGGGTVTVADAAGDLLRPTLLVPPAAVAGGSATGPPVVPLAATLPLGAVVGGVAYAVARRRPRPAPAPSLEEAMRRLADGRAAVEEIVAARDGASRAAIAAVWDPPPAPPELDEWIASLVTDGSLRATEGPAGEVVYRPAAPPAPAQITLDPEVLDRAIARRAEATGDER